MKRFCTQIKNLLACNYYSFRLKEVSKSRAILKPGEQLQITGIVRNNGFRPGTTYIIIELANPYDHSDVVFDSNRDFDTAARQTLRLIDISVFGDKTFGCDVQLPRSFGSGVLDIRLSLWTPSKLFNPPGIHYSAYCFHETQWTGFIELVTSNMPMEKVFLSFSWQSPEHLEWIRELSEELVRHNIDCIVSPKDLYAGEEITRFMEESVVRSPICIAVCSSSYTEKANKRDKGVGYEISVLTNEILNGRQRFTIIPVIKDNPAKKMPDCFGSVKYIDMEGQNWRTEPLLKLVTAVKRASEKLRR